ncbi:MAG TPA: plastocyanin/azurin family copper-binding protein [Candidatus Limnocylindrales bacterium]|nr:plastocyanin/azurin family copper-binding protein [Candidatus Limnocylindrales bacterium]
MHRKIALFLSTISAALLFGWAAAGSALAGDPCFHSTDRPAPSAGARVAIAIGDCVFSPTVTSVPVGTLVTWTNTSFQAHEIVGSNLTWGAHDKLLDPGDSMGWSFDKPGVYGYSCMLHPGMTGAIVVGAPDVARAADVQQAVAVEPAAGRDDSGSTLLPALVAGGAGLALGLLVGGLLMARRRGDAAV